MKTCHDTCQCQVFHQETLDHVQKNLYHEKEFEDIALFFKIFNDPTRLKILEAIKDHDLCVCDLAYLTGVSKSAISHQMKYLKSYHLVKSHKNGKMVFYRLLDLDVQPMIRHAYELMKGINTHEKND